MKHHALHRSFTGTDTGAGAGAGTDYINLSY